MAGLEFHPLPVLPEEDNQLLYSVFNNSFPGVWGPYENLALEVPPEVASPSSTEGDALEVVQHSAPGPVKEKSRRRESQNQASRNYRQRKKQQMEEVFAKLNALTLENERLKKENDEARNAAQQLLEENMNQKQVLAQLATENVQLKAGSPASQIKEAHEELNERMTQMEQAIAQGAPEEVIRGLLLAIQDQQRTIQKLKIRDVQQMISPSIQAKLVVLEKNPDSTPKVSCCKTWNKYLVEAGVSKEQFETIRQLKAGHHEQLREIYSERELLNKEIKEFYLGNLNYCGETPPVVTDGKLVLMLSQKLEQLRGNLSKELELQDATVGDLGSILTPQQEAILTVRQHSFQKMHVNSMEMLNNIWAAVSD